ETNGEVAVHCLVVEEVLLDHVSPVPKTKREVGEAVMRVELHDVPENWPATDIDEWLGPELGFFSQPRSLAATKDYSLHFVEAGAVSEGVLLTLPVNHR